MAELKTKESDTKVIDFINNLKDKNKIEDSLKLLEIFKKVTKNEAKMWGTSIIGFGKYHYKSERSTQEGDWPICGFSPRKQAFSVYLMSGFDSFGKELKELGKFKKSSGSCLYIKKMSDINEKVLENLIKLSIKELSKRYELNI